MIYRLSRLAFDLFFRLFCRVPVEGLERVPAEGPLLVAGNHASMIDPPLIGSVVARVRNPVRGFGKRELFEHPLVGWYFRGMRGIPVDRDRADFGALRGALGALKAGQAVLILPEGTRGKGGRRRRPNSGVSFLAHRSGAPVLPVLAEGTDGPPLPGRMRVRIAPPRRFDPSAVERLGAKKAYKDFAEQLMHDIYQLGGKAPSPLESDR